MGAAFVDQLLNQVRNLQALGESEDDIMRRLRATRYTDPNPTTAKCPRCGRRANWVTDDCRWWCVDCGWMSGNGYERMTRPCEQCTTLVTYETGKRPDMVLCADCRRHWDGVEERSNIDDKLTMLENRVGRLESMTMSKPANCPKCGKAVTASVHPWSCRCGEGKTLGEVSDGEEPAADEVRDSLAAGSLLNNSCGYCGYCGNPGCIEVDQIEGEWVVQPRCEQGAGRRVRSQSLANAIGEHRAAVNDYLAGLVVNAKEADG